MTPIPWSALLVDDQPLSIGRDFEVYAAQLGARRVIVKVAHSEADLGAEATALQRLGGRYTPELIGLTQLPGGRRALVRSFVDGVALSTLIERALIRHRWQGARRWNPPTRSLVAALLDAVAHVHDHGLVHNDLKPDDIFVSMRPDGTFSVVLVDLGLAARAGHGGPGGTVAYAAPERLEGEPGTVRSDVWALGAILFELLAGTRAYASDQPVDARLERRLPVHKSPREAAQRAWRQLPASVQGGLEAALASTARDRTKSVAALRRALDLERGDLIERPASVRSQPLQARRIDATGRTWIAAALATVVAVVIAWGPMSRALGLSREQPAGACEAMQRRAASLCRGLSGEAACRAALTASDDCAARAELLGACEAP